MSVNLALAIVRLVSSKQLRTYGMTQNRRRSQCNFLVWNSWLRWAEEAQLQSAVHRPQAPVETLASNYQPSTCMHFHIFIKICIDTPRRESADWPCLLHKRIWCAAATEGGEERTRDKWCCETCPRRSGGTG